MSEWISVEDRLPLYGREVDVFDSVEVIVTDGRAVRTADFNAGAHGEGWQNFSQYSDITPSAITHWQPLPDPPQ